MLPTAPADAPAPVDPLSALTGLESWPHLRFGFSVEKEAAPGDLQLVVTMSFVPPPVPPKTPEVAAESPGALPAPSAPASLKPGEAESSEDPAVTDLARYRSICEQWEAEVEVALKASFCAGPITPAGSTPPNVILRQNARTILGALEGPDGPEGRRPIELIRLAFALPAPDASPESYPARLLHPLAVMLHCSRAAGDEPDAAKPDEPAPVDDNPPAATPAEPAAPVARGGAEESAAKNPPAGRAGPLGPPKFLSTPARTSGAPSGRALPFSTFSEAGPPGLAAPPPSTVTPVPPQADAGVSPRTFANFATSFEAAYASLGWRVLVNDGDGCFVLAWQVKDGLQFSLSEPAAPAAAGFACPLISTIGQTRADISGTLLPAGFPAKFARAERWTVQDIDLDAELARFLEEVEKFLAPERRVAATAVAPALVERCVAARKTLAGLLAERVVPLGSGDGESPETKTARAAMREACREDLRDFHRIGAVAVLQLDVTAPQPLIVHGRFVPEAAPTLGVLPGAGRLAATANVLAFPIRADAADRGNDVRLAGAFRCEAIETVVAEPAERRGGRRLRFVSDGDTRVPAPPLCARLPVRAMPRPPELLRQAFLPLEGDGVVAAKSWLLACDTACDSLAQDTLRFGVAFTPAPPAGEAGTTAPTPALRPDLLDTLVIFRETLPAIRAALERGLRLAGGASAASPDPMAGEAVRAFVMLVEWVAQHFHLPAVEPAGGFEWDGYEERRDLTPPPDGPIVAGPFDVTLRSQARGAVQVVRNLTTGLPPAFQYPTRVTTAAEVLYALVDRERELDLATLPLLEHYMPDGPARGSLVDCLTRLLRAVIAAPGPAEEAPPVSVSLRVEFAARLAGSGEDGLQVRLPVAVVPPRQISAARRLLEMRAWARPIADHLEAWLAQSDPRRGGDFERMGARFVFDLTLAAAEGTRGASGRPWLHWRGLYFRCADAC